MEAQDKVQSLEKRVDQLTNVILELTHDDTDSLASRYIQEKLNSINTPNLERLGRQEMLEEVIALVYEGYFMYNRNFHGADADRTLQMKNLIHDLREMQLQEMV